MFKILNYWKKKCFKISKYLLKIQLKKNKNTKEKAVNTLLLENRKVLSRVKVIKNITAKANKNTKLR